MTIYSIKKQKTLQIVCILLFAIFYGCQTENNNELMVKFEEDFNDSIKRYKAEKFQYQYDGLTPQASYFVNSKIKFLKYVHSPENGTTLSFVYFNSSTDSIEKIIRRNITFVFEGNSAKSENFLDTTYVILLNPKAKTLKYVSNKLIDSSFNFSTSINDLNYIKDMKKEIEKAFNK